VATALGVALEMGTLKNEPARPVLEIAKVTPAGVALLEQQTRAVKEPMFGK